LFAAATLEPEAHMQPYLIAPSLLSADFARLGEEAAAVLKAGADMLHLDVMDNHYVPNLTVGPLVCAALRRYGITAPIDVHLMVQPVDRLIVDFAEAGATNITFHPEATEHIDRSLALIRDNGCKAGLALNPATTLDCLEYVLDKLDLILMMSVNPGFGGQAFIPAVLDKIARAKALIDRHQKPIRIAVDGGVKIDNIKQIAKAGADMFIAGSAIFNQPDYAKIIKQLREQLA
jgi:ribulose-phosphate 3-epimerase